MVAAVIAVILIGGVVVPVGGVVLAAQATPESSPAVSPEASGTPVAGATPVAGEAAVAASPEQQLIDRYAPIMALKNQNDLCDDEGEAYYPVPVNAVLGDPSVVLKQATTASSATDPVIKQAPTAQDLFAKGSDFYLDLPGDPRKPGCTYATWFAERKDALPPTTYAHIVANGTNRLAVQYWLYYVFNDFNNRHESDWEMVQIIFDVGTVEEALNTEPTQIALAQHGGGETAAWDDAKLQRDGTRPIVYAASGSHASQYGSAVYLGWGEGGTGFGCDTTTGPSHLVPLTAVLLPNKVSDPNSEFAWLTYTGRWGERKSGEDNGPTGPNTKKQWTSPFVWQAGLRDSSLEVPGARTFGPAPTSVFCSLSATGSHLFSRLVDNRVALLTTAVAIVVAIIVLVRYAWGTLGLAVRVYRRRWKTFALIGLMLIPIGIVFNGFQYLVGHYPPGSTVLSVMGRSPGSYVAVALLVGIVQQLVSLVVVGPAVISTYGEMEQHERLTAMRAYKRVAAAFPRLILPVLKATAIVVVLSLTVIGIPVALWLLVRWLFIPQAVMLDGEHGDSARDASARSVDGHWRSTALKAILFTVIGAAPGPLVGLALLIFGSVGVQTTNVVSSLIYAVALPISIIGLTILYRQHQGKAITPADYDERTAVEATEDEGGIAPAPAV
ncbi:MAG: hypothetical protein ACTHMX_13200 [Thermomicrobiales bacterium]